YADTIIARICARLEDEESPAIDNLERVLERLQAHHGSGESLGCLLGVAIAQVDREDDELVEILQSYVQRMELAVERAVRRAQTDAALRTDLRPREVAHNLVALTQGMALLGRIHSGSSPSRSVRAVLQGLRPGSRGAGPSRRRRKP